jgi:hypothetical protein
LVVENAEELAQWPAHLLAGLPMGKRLHVSKRLSSLDASVDGHARDLGGDEYYDAKAVGFRLWSARLVQPRECWPAVLEASGIGRTLRFGNRMDAVSRHVRAARVGERNRLLFWASCRFGEMIAERHLHPADAVYSLMCDAGACRLSLDDGREACLDTIASGFSTIEALLNAARDIVVRGHNGGPVMGADE